MIVVNSQRKASLIKYSVPFTVAISLICPVPGSLRAQEIKQTAPKVSQTKVYANQARLSRESASLRTSPVSIQNSEPTTSIAPINLSSSFELTPTSLEKYSLTQLEVGELSAQTLETVHKNQFTLAQQTPTQELAPNLTYQEPLTQSNQPPEENKETEKSPSRSTSSDSEDSNPEFPVRFYLGPDFFYRNYSERNAGKSDEFGTLYGLQANLDYVKGKNVYFGLGFRYGAGQTAYSGSDRVTGTVPFKSTTENDFFNIEGRLGYTFQAGQPKHRFLVSPFVALGYHQWNRDISGNFTTPIGPISGTDTSETYSWGYAGPGFHAEYKVSPKFTIGLNAKLMFMFGGNIDAKDSFRGVVNQGGGNLGNDLQYEIELPLTYTIVQNSKNAIDLKLTPYYRSQDIALGQPFTLSNGNGVIEPASITSVYGATFGVQFRF